MMGCSNDGKRQTRLPDRVLSSIILIGAELPFGNLFVTVGPCINFPLMIDALSNSWNVHAISISLGEYRPLPSLETNHQANLSVPRSAANNLTISVEHARETS